MRRLMPAVALAGSLFTACSSGGGDSLADFRDSSSYAIGMNMGTGLKRTQADVDLSILIQGLTDVIEERETQLTPEGADGVLRTLTGQLEEAASGRREAESDKNRAAGDAYRAAHAKREGVQTTASGLQYEILTPGNGPKPEATDRVTVHYRGTLVDGSEFDSSYESGEPVTFSLNRVIPGWTEALQLMPVGSMYRIVLPPELGYGERGSPPAIPPNATLIFDVELLAIEQ